MTSNFEEKAIIGLVESVVLHGKDKKHIFKAKIDTGATKSSLDVSLVKLLGLGPVLGEKVIKNANGTETRSYIDVTIEINGHVVTEHFTIANRKHMTYPILIGKNILKKGKFLIDPNRKSRIFNFKF